MMFKLVNTCNITAIKRKVHSLNPKYAIEIVDFSICISINTYIHFGMYLNVETSCWDYPCE